MPLNRGCLILAEMSSAGSLAVGEYTAKAVAMAERHTDFVIGFIGQQRYASLRDYLLLTPGVALQVAGDAMGQQYRTPGQAVQAGADVIIVGRGVYSAEDVVAAAVEYKNAGWRAYLEKMAK